MPTDPCLRRATWSVMGDAVQGYPALAVARVVGRQTIGRAELSAIVWVARCPGSTTAVIDTFFFGRVHVPLRRRSQ